MTKDEQDTFALDLDELHVEVAQEAQAENTAAMHEALAVGRVAVEAGPHPMTWGEAADSLSGTTPRHSPDSSVRDVIYHAHRFKCVTCGRVDADALQLGHMLSCHEARILSVLVGRTQPLAVCRYDSNLMPQCRRCNGSQGSVSFAPEAAWDAMQDARERRIPWPDARDILRLLSIAETRRELPKLRAALVDGRRQGAIARKDRLDGESP